MGPQTFSFTVQLQSNGVLNVHQWSALYSDNGRQRPTHDASEHDVDARVLEYMVSEFVDLVLLSRRLAGPAQEPQLPMP